MGFMKAFVGCCAMFLAVLASDRVQRPGRRRRNEVYPLSHGGGGETRIEQGLQHRGFIVRRRPIAMGNDGVERTER